MKTMKANHILTISITVLSLGLLAAPVPEAPAQSDSDKSLADLRAKAESGDAEAQYDLGQRYGKGDGVKKDDAEAVKWYRKAAEQNLTKAQKNLADFYKNGRGVPQDYGEALKWYRKAAERNNAGAQYSLGCSYANGEGVEKDMAEAYKWTMLAAGPGHKEGKKKGKGKGQENAKEYMTILERSLTPEQLAEGKRRADEWRKQQDSKQQAGQAVVASTQETRSASQPKGRKGGGAKRKPADAGSLEQLLGVGKTEYRESSGETQKLWDRILKALENNQPRIASERLIEFHEVKDLVEPYQKTFASLAVGILARPASTSTVTSASTPQYDQILAWRKRTAELRKKMQAEEDKRPALLKRMQNPSAGAAIAGRVFDSFVGGKTGSKVAHADADAARKELHEVDRTIANYRKLIAAHEHKIKELQQESAEEADRRNQAAADRSKAFRLKVVGCLNDMMKENRPRPVIALANLWVNKRGEDAEVSKMAQRALDLQKTEAKANKIAEAARKPAADLMKQGRFWEAQAELAKAVQLIGSRITDRLELQFIQRDMTMTETEIKEEIAKALKQLQTIHELAQRDINEATKAFEAFRARYPDYPDMEQAKMKLGDTRTAQVEAKTTKKIAAVERVIPNDPEEAKAMIKRLLESGVDPDEASILKAKLVKLNRDTLDRELELVRKDLDEAQSYLTKASASYARELREGKKPTLSLTETFSSGMENIVRARSFQAGGVKRLEVLLGQEMDTVTKSRLVGLLETQKAALQQMDGLLEQRDQNKMIMVGAGSIGGLGLLIGLGLAAMKMKKNRR